MTKIILTIVFTLVSIVSFGQTSLNNILHDCYCDCHYDFHKCIPFHKNNDTLVYVTKYEIFNSNISKEYWEFHYDKTDIKNITDSIKQTVFESAKKECELMNFHRLTEIGETFKHGFINSWSWSTNFVNGINFKINYTNTNSKTIKYIDIYFIVKNPVGDICRISYNNGSNTGHLRCVGPIEQYDSGTWSWDAVYYTTGDASNLHFTKFVITYMDNTKYTLIKELAYKYYTLDNIIN